MDQGRYQQTNNNSNEIYKKCSGKRPRETRIRNGGGGKAKNTLINALKYNAYKNEDPEYT